MKELPVTTPLIQCYPYHANLLSVIQNHSEAFPWILDNYLELEMPDPPLDLRLDFSGPSLWKTCPFVYYQRIERHLVNTNWSNLWNFITQCINNGNYIYLLVNHYHLPVSRYYHNNKVIHDLFIYGYDEQTGMLKVADNFNNKYTYEYVAYKDIKQAYKDMHEEDDWVHGIELIRYRSRPFCFDPLAIKEKLNRYLNSTNLFFHFRIPAEFYKLGWYYGISVYDKLFNHLQLIIEGKSGYDGRPFHVLYEHKTILHQLCNFLEQQGHLPEHYHLSLQFKELAQQTLLLRNHYIKISMTNRLNMLDSLMTKIKQIKANEQLLLSQLINNLSGHNGMQENNLAQAAIITSNSTSLNLKYPPSNLAIPDINMAYLSDEQPTFPVYIEFSWEQPQAFNLIRIKTRFALSIGITDFVVELRRDQKTDWKKVYAVSNLPYEYNDFNIETTEIKLPVMTNIKKLRFTILHAHTVWNRFEINWIGIYDTTSCAENISL
ncbi:hypothetical protein ACN92M_23870 [Paenibacillus polymyxa]|uniref:hypothetical protein n=1 Tax=Paenibacillus polymyxa TaxID=1406 RepID=UPI001A0CDAE3|nr:hypothetical protein H6F38_20380 [Paenibacillus sp. EKM208P]